MGILGEAARARPPAPARYPRTSPPIILRTRYAVPGTENVLLRARTDVVLHRARTDILLRSARLSLKSWTSTRQASPALTYAVLLPGAVDNQEMVEVSPIGLPACDAISLQRVPAADLAYMPMC
eukprot:1185409-Rhodomonas_salina.2